MTTPRFVLDTLLRRRLLGPTTMSPVARTLSSLASSSYARFGAASTVNGASGLSSIPSNLVATFVVESSSSSMSVQKRWKHAGKIGHMKETLEEMAHKPEREAAQERRKKNKERSAAKRKGKKGADAGPETGEPSAALDEMDEEDSEDNFDFDDDFETGEGEDEEPSLPAPDDVKERMLSLVDRFQESLMSIRGSEPTPEIFDDIQVNAYGSMTPLKAVGQVVIASPTLAQITCFDPSVANDVSKAIQLALELNPQVDEGGMVKVPPPRVSMDVRQQTAKQLKKKAESCRQRVRQVRRKAMDVVKKGKDGKLAGVSKDDAFAIAKEIEGVTESAMKSLQDMVDTKMDSIMAV
jgi:ribosome recycling factor